jgi:hypothetical protein
MSFLEAQGLSSTSVDSTMTQRLVGAKYDSSDDGHLRVLNQIEFSFGNDLNELKIDEIITRS